MPTKQLETLAKKAGKTTEEAEACWNRAKKQADKIFKKQDNSYWGFVMSKTEECLGLKEKKSKALEDW